MRKLKQYAVYKGEELLVMGSAKECAEKLGVKEATVRFYSTPAYRDRLEGRKAENNRIVTIAIDD